MLRGPRWGWVPWKVQYNCKILNEDWMARIEDNFKTRIEDEKVKLLAGEVVEVEGVRFIEDGVAHRGTIAGE